jgi:hypothetical protein
MGGGVADKCLRDRCLARWTVPIPLVAAEAEQVERTRGRPGHGPDPRFCALYHLDGPTRPILVSARPVDRRDRRGHKELRQKR